MRAAMRKVSCRASSVSFLVLAALVALPALAAPPTAPLAAPAADDVAPTEPVPPVLSPQESLEKFVIQDGYRLELVLSEPEIKEPVQVTFDGNGRMYVTEMRSYMQDIDGTGEHTPVSRVSRHESSRRDGKFDRHKVFADGLMLPRMVLP